MVDLGIQNSQIGRVNWSCSLIWFSFMFNLCFQALSQLVCIFFQLSAELIYISCSIECMCFLMLLFCPAGLLGASFFSDHHGTPFWQPQSCFSSLLLLLLFLLLLFVRFNCSIKLGLFRKRWFEVIDLIDSESFDHLLLIMDEVLDCLESIANVQIHLLRFMIIQNHLYPVCFLLTL